MISYKSLQSIRGHLHEKYEKGCVNEKEQLKKLISIVENEMEIQEQLGDTGYREVMATGFNSSTLSISTPDMLK